MKNPDLRVLAVLNELRRTASGEGPPPFSTIRCSCGPGNVIGLQDALRAINRAGGTIEADWLLEWALRIGDEATEGRTLSELYGKMVSQPFAQDLRELWEQLCVAEQAQGIVLDAKAPVGRPRVK